MTTRTSWRTPLVVLVCGTAILVIAMGVRMTYGLWLGPASADLGWGLRELSFAMALQALLWGLAAPFAGGIADRFGAGRVVAAGALGYAGGLYLMSQASSALEATLSIGFLTGIAMSACAFPIVIAVLSRAVEDERKRGIYIGIASAGGSSGQFVMVPLAQHLLDGLGWATTLVVLAGMVALIAPLGAALAGRYHGAPSASPKQGMGEALREAFAHRGYALLSAGYFVCGFQTLFITTHFPKMLEGHDVSADMAAWGIALIGLFNTAGCFIWGVLGGRLRKKHLLCWLYGLRSVAMAAFMLTPISDASVAAFSAAMGILWLGTVPLTGGVVAQIFGVRYMAMLFGFCFVAHQVGSFIGIWAAGWLYDQYGSFDAIWWASIVLGVVAGLLNYPIDDRPVARLAERPAGA
jgi:MFS family permease